MKGTGRPGTEVMAKPLKQAKSITEGVSTQPRETGPCAKRLAVGDKSRRYVIMGLS